MSQLAPASVSPLCKQGGQPLLAAWWLRASCSPGDGILASPGCGVPAGEFPPVGIQEGHEGGWEEKAQFRARASCLRPATISLPQIPLQRARILLGPGRLHQHRFVCPCSCRLPKVTASTRSQVSSFAAEPRLRLLTSLRVKNTPFPIPLRHPLSLQLSPLTSHPQAFHSHCPLPETFFLLVVSVERPPPPGSLP